MARNALKNISRLLDSVNKEMPVNEAFLFDLKKSIEKTADNETRKPSQTYKPSSMKCIRNMYYQVSGATADTEHSSYCTVGICNSGTDTHIRIQSYIENMKDFGVDCEYIDVADFVTQRGLTDIEIKEKSGMETKLYHKKYNMSFMCDGIIKYKNHYYILEIKTEASFKWQKRINVDESHYNQGTAYSIAFNLPEIIFLYINRDVMDIKAYLFIPTDEMKQDLIGLITECDNYVSEHRVPPKPEDVPKRICDYCNYKNLCKGEI